MQFARPLESGVFLKRRQRFFADINWKNQTIVAHLPNTGSMKGCNVPGASCRFSHAENPDRKLKYTLEMIQVPSGAWVGVNTATPNKIVAEALTAGLFPHWKKIESIKPEFKISAETRFDFLVNLKGGARHFVEVKNVTLVEDNIAKFPDSVTERGQKHLRELIKLVEAGDSAEVVFTVQRDDAKFFAPADDIDPEYGKLLRLALKAGVKITPVVVVLGENEIHLSKEILKLKID